MFLLHLLQTHADSDTILLHSVLNEFAYTE